MEAVDIVICKSALSAMILLFLMPYFKSKSIHLLVVIWSCHDCGPGRQEPKANKRPKPGRLTEIVEVKTNSNLVVCINGSFKCDVIFIYSRSMCRRFIHTNFTF